MTIVTTLGVESLVNTSTFGDQAQARGTALANGQYVVVWVDYLIPGQLTDANTANADIKARLFNADGTPAGAEFLVNTTTAGGQIFCNAITLSDGHFLVTWNNGAGTVLGGSGAPIATARGQEFTAAGVPVGGEFAIGAPGVETLLVASSALAGGGFVSTWQQGGIGGAIIAQIYDSNNVAVGGQIVVDNTYAAPISGSSVRTLAGGNFVVAWNQAIGGSTYTKMQIFTSAGVPVGQQITNLPATQGGNLTSMVALANGGFAVSTIELVGNTFSLKIYAFDSDGNYFGSREVAQQFVGVNGSNPQGLSLAALANGGVAATWVDNNTTDGSGTSVHLTVYGPSGNQIDNSVIVNTNTGGNQITPTMLTLSNGDFVTLWSDASGTLGDSSGTSIKQQIFDVSTVNRAPVAMTDSFIAIGGLDGFPVSVLTGNDTDADGDILIVTSITNVTGGTLTFDFVNQGFDFTRPQGSLAPVEFDYTISDGAGGTASAHAILLATRSDLVTLRGNAAPIEFLANDYLLPRAEGYAYTASVVSGNGGTQPAPLVVQTANGPRIAFATLNVPGYLTLPVGQTIEVRISYTVSNPVTLTMDYNDVVYVTLQGWAQIGGTGFDALVGGAAPDHLIGGSGTPNELQGRGGDDYYTVSAIGDTIIEEINGGTDTVFTSNLTSFVLPANVENLFDFTAAAGHVFVGNDLNNQIGGTSFRDSLSGGGGDDTLFGSFGEANEVAGGTGNDIFVVRVAGDTIIEFAGEGIDTVQTSLAAYELRAANVENLTFIGTGSFSGTGNALDNVITGGTAAASTLVGLGGNDTYVVRNAGDSIVEAAASGTDTVQTALSFYRLNAANVENLTYTGTGNFTGIGNAENNVITGGAGADYLYAGAGTDTLVGGAGADVFLFDQAVNGVDTISDFTSGSDRLFFNQSVFTHTPVFALVQGAGAQVATSANSSFLYNSTTGALSFDADGNGTGAAIAVANLAPGLTLTQADFVFYG